MTAEGLMTINDPRSAYDARRFYSVPTPCNSVVNGFHIIYNNIIFVLLFRFLHKFGTTLAAFN